MKKRLFFLATLLILGGFISTVSCFVDEDVNMDGNVTVLDLISVGYNLGLGLNNCDLTANNWCSRTDVSRDSKVNVVDIIRVGMALSNSGSDNTIETNRTSPNWNLPFGTQSEQNGAYTALVGTVAIRYYTLNRTGDIQKAKDYMEAYKDFFEKSYRDALPKDKVPLQIKYEIVPTVVPDSCGQVVNRSSDENIRKEMGANWGFTFVGDGCDITHNANGGMGEVIYPPVSPAFPVIGCPDCSGPLIFDTVVFFMDSFGAQEGYGSVFNLTNHLGIYGTASYNSGGVRYSAPSPPGFTPEWNLLTYGTQPNEDYHKRGIGRAARQQVGWMDSNYNGVNDLFEVSPKINSQVYSSDRITVNTTIGLFYPQGYSQYQITSGSWSSSDFRPIGGNWSVDRIYALWGHKNTAWINLINLTDPEYNHKFDLVIGSGYDKFAVETVAGWTNDAELNAILNPANTVHPTSNIMHLGGAVSYSAGKSRIGLTAMVNNRNDYGPPILGLQQNPSLSKVEFFERVDGNLVKIGEDTNGSLPSQWHFTSPYLDPVPGYKNFTARLLDIWGRYSDFTYDLILYVNVPPVLTELNIESPVIMNSSFSLSGKATDEILPGVYQAPSIFRAYVGPSNATASILFGGGSINSNGTINTTLNFKRIIVPAAYTLQTGFNVPTNVTITKKCTVLKPGVYNVSVVAVDSDGAVSNSIPKNVTVLTDGIYDLMQNNKSMLNVQTKQIGPNRFNITVESIVAKDRCPVYLAIDGNSAFVTIIGNTSYTTNMISSIAGWDNPAGNYTVSVSNLSDSSGYNLVYVKFWDDSGVMLNQTIKLR